MRSLGLAAAVVVGLVVGAEPAAADTVIFQDGGVVSGALELSEILLATSGGEVRLAPGDVQTVTLGQAAGDVVALRNGRTLTGRVDHPDYTVRLPSGQTLLVARGGVDQLHFGRR
ncbi:MAG: hypothetical protein ACREMB_12145 [Candidatus Rokuibacteriota bacterium]